MSSIQHKQLKCSHRLVVDTRQSGNQKLGQLKRVCVLIKTQQEVWVCWAGTLVVTAQTFDAANGLFTKTHLHFLRYLE